MLDFYEIAGPFRLHVDGRVVLILILTPFNEVSPCLIAPALFHLIVREIKQKGKIGTF